MNKNELLNIIYSCCDNKTKCTSCDLTNVTGLTALEILPILRELKSENLISVYLGGDIVMELKGINYLKEIDSLKALEKSNKMKKVLINTLKWLISPLTAIGVAFAIWYFGWN